MLIYLGYISSIVIGFTLGIFGGGGSILTVPVLVYLFHFSPVIATSYSLFIIGVSTLIGAISQIKNGIVNFKAAITFLIPSIIGTFSARKIILPSIPEKLLTINKFILTKDTAILIFFGIIMLLASYSMINAKKQTIDKDEKKWNIPLIILASFIIGIVTGLVGAGGGFLIIPSLVFFMNLDMKEAVATSITIISINSLTGFIGSFLSGLVLDLKFMISFSLLTIIGILIGMSFAKNIPSQKLKPAFGWFVMMMGTFIIIKESLF